ncbi:M23 family metallopeptidase [Burkholderia pyrrocinia]|uniref:M23 family metallopeptidase n=1 Tax=Burkholderia pyrrocinia TaxID=60550 RepID=UPI00158C0810|nr:M23 family metallopeptidase [Burkholderia pyrrocinia]
MVAGLALLGGAAGALWICDASSTVMQRAMVLASTGTNEGGANTLTFAAQTAESRARGWAVLRQDDAGAFMSQLPMRDALHEPPPVRLSLDAPVLVSMCRQDATCVLDEARGPARPLSGATPAAAVEVAQQPNGASLAGASAFVLPPEDAGVRAGAIERSLRDALKRADLPADAAAQVTRIFGARVAVDAKPRAGDYFRVIYERTGADAARARPVRVSAVELRLAGTIHRAVWFEPARGKGAYYAFDGKPLAEAPFAMPVARARITSPFGTRVHPISGVHHGHTGVDLAAPTGTPVHASAAGTLQFVGWEPGYGNYVVVRHADGHTSWYGHLSAFAKGLRKGMPIAQGQLLGAVGSTGTATGPHLHFEVRMKNRPVDPIRLTTAPASPPLTGERRVAFERTIRDVKQQFAALEPVRTASASASAMR